MKYVARDCVIVLITIGRTFNLLLNDGVEFNNDECNTDAIIFSSWCEKMWNKIVFIRFIVNFKFLNRICYRDVIGFFIK